MDESRVARLEKEVALLRSVLLDLLNAIEVRGRRASEAEEPILLDEEEALAYFVHGKEPPAEEPRCEVCGTTMWVRGSVVWCDTCNPSHPWRKHYIEHLEARIAELEAELARLHEKYMEEGTRP